MTASKSREREGERWHRSNEYLHLQWHGKEIIIVELIKIAINESYRKSLSNSICAFPHWAAFGVRFSIANWMTVFCCATCLALCFVAHQPPPFRKTNQPEAHSLSCPTTTEAAFQLVNRHPSQNHPHCHSSIYPFLIAAPVASTQIIAHSNDLWVLICSSCRLLKDYAILDWNWK